MEGSLAELPTSTQLGLIWRCFNMCFVANGLEVLGAEFSSWHQLCAGWHSVCIYTDISDLTWKLGYRKCCDGATDGAAVRFCRPWVEKLARSSCYHPKALQQVTCWCLFICWSPCPLSGGVQPRCPCQRTLTALVTFLLVFRSFSADLKLANHVS